MKRLFSLLLSQALTMPKQAQQAFYAVRSGRMPGIFFNWADCESQVKDFPQARYKKFSTVEDAAEFALNIDANSKAQPNKRARSSSPEADVPKKKSSGVPDVENLTGSTFDDKDGTSVYTDGGCFMNGQKGAQAGIGVFWGVDHKDNVSERLPGRPTNNRAEIHAAIKAVDIAKRKGIKNLILHTDSQFMINGITKWIKKWKKNNWTLSSGEPVINKEDFEGLDEMLQGINVKWVHVKAHSGNKSNDAVDALAKKGAYKPLDE